MTHHTQQAASLTLCHRERQHCTLWIQCLMVHLVNWNCGVENCKLAVAESLQSVVTSHHRSLLAAAPGEAWLSTRYWVMFFRGSPVFFGPMDPLLSNQACSIRYTVLWHSTAGAFDAEKLKRVLIVNYSLWHPHLSPHVAFTSWQAAIKKVSPHRKCNNRLQYKSVPALHYVAPESLLPLLFLQFLLPLPCLLLQHLLRWLKCRHLTGSWLNCWRGRGSW